jgi:hypothetical protein
MTPEIQEPTVSAIVIAEPAGAQQRFAAAELRRYVYLRTGVLLDIAAKRTSAARFAFHLDAELPAEAYRLRTRAGCLEISSANEQGLLYGAYAVAEKLGVRFYLHGDVVPDARIPFAVPVLDETAQPYFAVRGILPFHDFPEGPDWWNEDDYLAYVGQLAKLRMNFIGLHAYPEGGAGPEPLVWIGPPGDIGPDGAVAHSYPSFWHNTARGGTWGYEPLKTEDFTGGASLLFATNYHGPDVMEGLVPLPATPEESNELFRRVGLQMGRVFAHARKLGVKSCVGTETPLTVPKAIRERLKAQGRNPRDPAVVKELYRGMFERIAAVMPADYYWLWTPEDWTWKNNTPEEFEHTLADIRAAYEALKESKAPMQLATSGWVLGPVHDRSALDAALPKDVAMSAIHRAVGHESIDAAYARVRGRSTWAIPWVENDPNMIAYQPWAGRMRFDAVDARRHGCDGLIGIHWRTQILAANWAALAGAAWDQSWIPAGTPTGRVEYAAPEGNFGKPYTIRSAVTGAETNAVSEVYKTGLHGMDALSIEIPNGEYAITLHFCEPEGLATGPRVFDVALQGRTVVERLNIKERVGVNAVCDVVAPGVRVDDGVLKLAFTRREGEPLISGLIVDGVTDAANQIASEKLMRRYNIGGGQAPGYEVFLPGQIKNPAGHKRGMPVEDLYVDFARAHFGPEIGDEAGRLLAQMDGEGFRPDPSGWINGPGGIPVGASYAEAAEKKRALVDAFAALRTKLTSPGDRARFDYWLNTLRASITMHDIAFARHRLKEAMSAIAGDRGRAESALAIRIELARLWDRLMAELIATVNTPGELGTIANVEQHNRLKLQVLTEHDRALESRLGRPLPPEIEPRRTYAGPARLVLPTVRNAVNRGEALALRMLALDREVARRVVVKVRPLGGGGAWTEAPADHVARAVWRARLPAATADFEYFVEAEFGGAGTVVWPVTAPALCQTVVVWPD